MKAPLRPVMLQAPKMRLLRTRPHLD
jgi:hypothetical protein